MKGQHTGQEKGTEDQLVEKAHAASIRIWTLLRKIRSGNEVIVTLMRLKNAPASVQDGTGAGHDHICIAISPSEDPGILQAALGAVLFKKYFCAGRKYIKAFKMQSCTPDE